MRRRKRALILIGMVALLAAVSVLAASCGNKVARQTQTSTSNTGNATIDNAVNDLDSQVNSVSPDDFNDAQLSDSALGF